MTRKKTLNDKDNKLRLDKIFQLAILSIAATALCHRVV